MQDAEAPIPVQEAERLRRLRKQMREQDEKRYRDPDYNPSRPQIHVLYAWHHKKWNFITWIRGRITPKRVSKLREKFRRRIPEDSTLRIIQLGLVMRGEGPGSAPLAPPSRRKTRIDKQNAKVEQTRYPKKRIDTTGYSKCSVKSGKKCAHRAPWYVGYTRNHKRIIRACCTRHAWDEHSLPAGARNVVRVQRTKR